jgi:MOSC domain-containing protein YiiM
MTGTVVAVSLSGSHTFSKKNQLTIRLLAGLGVEGDAHAGKTVKHRSRVAKDPNQPNIRQVHLIHAELLDDLDTANHNIAPGQMGENITTRGINLLNLPQGTLLHMGGEAIVEITGLRNPCKQLDNLSDGLMEATFARDGDSVRPLSGVMGIVSQNGDVKPNDAIRVELPSEPHIPLEKV